MADPFSVFTPVASSDDGDLWRSGAVYPPTSGVSYNYGAANMVVGSGFDGATYWTYISLARWDTSPLPDGAVVTKAELSVYVISVTDTDGRNLAAEWYPASNWPIGVDDWTNTPGSDANAGVPFSSLVVDAYNTITLSNAAANVVLDGYTGLRLHVDGGQPTGGNYVQLATRDSANPPKLVVYYASEVAASDSGTGTETVNLQAAGSVLDVGSGADAATVLNSPALADGEQTTMEAVGMGAAYDPAYDTGVGMDAATVLAAPAPVTDAGAGADAASILATLATLADTGFGVEGVSVLLDLLLADSGAGIDAAAVAALLASVADFGGGADAAVVNAALAAIAETGTGVDEVFDLLQLHVYIRTDGTIDPLGVILLRGGREDMMPAPREYTDAVPGRPGEVDFGADPGPRGLELRAASQGGLTVTQKTALKRYVAGWLRPSLGVFNIAWEDDPDRYLEVRVAGNIQPEEYASYLEFTIPLKATQPMYLGSVLQFLTGSGTATCDGNMETPATVTITGPVTNPSVTVAGLTFTYTGTVGANDSLVVDGGRKTVTFNGVNSLSGFSGDFPELQPGDNTVTAASAGTTTVTWRDRWI